MTFNLQKIAELTSQWNILSKTHLTSNPKQISSDLSLEDSAHSTEQFLCEMVELNQKTQAVLDSIPLSLPIGLQQQKESKNWHRVLFDLSNESLKSISQLDQLKVSGETEPLAIEVLANCLATATTTQALAKTFRFLISSSYETEAIQMVAQAFGNQDLAPVHEIEKVPKTTIKKLLADLYGEEIVKKIFNLYNLKTASDISGDDLRALLVGILANLDESALKHIVSNKERHKQITGFAFFDQFLTHSHSKKDKRFSELQGNKLTGFLDCLRKSLQDVDVDVLLSKKFGYAQQLSRDLNLLCYCSQATLNPRFSIRLSSILSTFPNEAQIIDTLIPLSDQSLLPLSQMLQDASDEKPAVSSNAASDSFFPKETLSYHLNNESLHRIRHSEAQESAEQGPFALPNLSTSRPMAAQSLEPFEFLQTRHPLTEIALMIEHMKAGTLTINAAQKIKIELDPESKELFNPHESALFENPGSFFYLYDLVERMNAQTIDPDQQAVLETFNALDDHLRKSIASLIYQLSDNPAKKTIPNWGEAHAADDLSLMLKAIIAVKNNIFDFSYEKIKARATSLIESLSPEKQTGINYEIYRIAKPITDDPDWGANNALVKVSRLVAALHIRQALPGPKLLSYPETTEELPLPLAPSLAPDLDISHDSHMTAAFSQPASATPILSEVSEPKANQRKHHPFFELASMIEKWQSGSLTLNETQNIAFHLDNELEALFGIHEQAFIADPFTYFNFSELVRQMVSGDAAEDKSAIMETFQNVNEHLRNSLASKVFELSKDSSKGNVKNWGEVHAADDLVCLKAAIDSLTNKILKDIYSKITRFAASKLSSPENIESVRTEHSTLEDPIRVENSSPAKTSLLIETLQSNGKIDLPRDVSTENPPSEVHKDVPQISHISIPTMIGSPSHSGNTRSEVHKDVPQISHISIPTMIGSPSHSGKPLNSPSNRSHFRSSPFNHRTPVKNLNSPKTPLDNAALKRMLSPSSPLGNATPKGLLSPNKTADNAESFQKTFIALSPFSPKKKEQVNTSTPVARVLFPPNTGNKSTPIPLPPPPRGQLGSLASKRASPEELHQKSELNRLKRESENRLKFSDMYGREPLSSDNLEKVFRLEGNISSCKTTINLLQKQGNETEFSDTIIKALQKSIEEHESDIKKIKNSARITLEDFESFKSHIKYFSSDELKLICCAVYPEMTEFPAMIEIGQDLKSFYRSFPNNELKAASKEHSELYTKLLVEGSSRYVGFMISTIKERTINPKLEPIHEVRPFKRKNKETSTPNASDTPKQTAQTNMDLSQITSFRFKPRMTPQIEKLQPDSANSTPFSPFPQLKSRPAPQSPSVLSQTDAASANPAELLKQSKIILQQRRIEEGQQAKMQQMRVDFTREKLVALARMSLINNPSLEEEKRELDQQLAILENIPENQTQRTTLEQQLQSVTSKIEQKKKEEQDARQFIVASNTWTTDVEHPFATKERLVIAKEYAERQMKVQNRS